MEKNIFSKIFRNEKLRVILLYSIIVIILTYPFIYKIHNHLFRGFLRSEYNNNPVIWEPRWDGAHPDTFGFIYTMAWISHSLTTDPKNLFNANIFYPNKNVLAYHNHNFTNALIALPFNAILKNPVLAYNFLVFFSYISAAFGMYLLTKFFIDDKLISFTSGLMFVFTWLNYFYIQGIEVISTEWIPLTFLYLFKFLDSKKTKHIFLFLIFFLLGALTSWYFLVYLVYSLALLIIIQIIYRWREILTPRNLILFLIIFILAAAVIYPISLPYLENRHQFPDFKRTKANTLMEADYLDYYLLTIDKMKYLQYILCAYILITLLGRKKDSENENRLMPAKIFFLLLAFFSFLLSLGPRLKAFGKVRNIPLPYTLLFDYFPGFEITRNPRRFEVLLNLSLSFIACLAIWYIIKMIKGDGVKKAVKIALILIPIVNYSHIANFPNMLQYCPRGDEVYKVYKWLASLNEDVSIYQTSYNKQNGFAKPGHSMREAIYTYYSIYHWKKTVNGIATWIPPSFRKLINMEEQFPSKKFLNELRNLGTNYIIVIDCVGDLLDVKNGPLEELLRDNEIRLIKKDTGIKKLRYNYAYEIIYKNKSPQYKDIPS